MPEDPSTSTMDNTIRGRINWRKVDGQPKRNPGEGASSNEPGTWLQYVFEVQAYKVTAEDPPVRPGDSDKAESIVLLDPDPFAVSSIVKAEDTASDWTVHYLIRLTGSVPSTRIVRASLQEGRTWVGGPAWPLGHIPSFVPAPDTQIFVPPPEGIVLPPGTVVGEYAHVDVKTPRGWGFANFEIFSGRPLGHP